MDKTGKILLSISGLCMAGCLLCMGIFIGTKIQPEKIITKTIEIPKIETITKTETEYIEIEVPKYKNVYIEKEIEIPTYPDLRDFESKEELYDWANNNWIAEFIIPWNTETNLFKPDDNNDCDDQALRMRDRAAKDGFYVYPALVKDGKLIGVKVVESTDYHMGCIAITDNEVFYLDIMNEEPVFIGYLD